MTEQEKMQEVRNSNNLVSKMYDNMVVYYNQETGMVFVEDNAEICPCHNPYRPNFMVAYKYTNIASKMCNPDVIVRILTEMPDIKKKFVAWLQREDKSDVNCPVTIADVFAKKLFEPEWSEEFEDDYEPEYNDEPEYCHCRPSQDDLRKAIAGCIVFCLSGITGVLSAIDRQLSNRGY